MMRGNISKNNKLEQKHVDASGARPANNNNIQ